MINVDKLLGQILGSGQLGSSQGKSLVGGLLIGGLAGALTGKGGQKIAGSALKLGGAAAVAGLAYAAYQRYRAAQPATPLPTGAPTPHHFPGADSNVAARAHRVEDIVDVTPLRHQGYLPAATDTEATESLSLKLIRAMIGAAKADGRIDAGESTKIFGQMEAQNLGPEEKSFLLTEIGKPLTAHDVAATAQTPEEAAEIYAVSVLAVNPNGVAEQGYLAELAHLLRLEPALAREIKDGIASA